MLERAPVLVAAVALVGWGSAVLVPQAAAAAQPVAAPTAPGAAPTAPPSELVALAQKMEALRVSSERFRVRILLSASGAHLPKQLRSILKLLNLDASGEFQNTPPEGAFKLTIIGHTAAVRVVNGHVYVYDPTAAKLDGGRPWIDFGRSPPLGGGPGGLNVSSGVGVTSFKRLGTALAGARNVTQLGAGTVDGQAITGFKATVAASALEEPTPPVPVKPKGIFAPIGIGSSVKGAAASATLEVFIAASGLPVQTRIVQREEGVTTSALADIFAINFPVKVEPPPRAQTVGLAALRKLARQHATEQEREARVSATPPESR